MNGPGFGVGEGYEVSLKVNPDDLEKVLERSGWPDIDLDHQDLSVPIGIYLKKHFTVENSKGEQSELHYVGKEVGLDWAYLYFEMSLTQGLHGSKVTNNFFFELQKNQVNTVLLGEGEFTTSLRLVHGAPHGILEVPEEHRARNRLARVEALGRSYRAKLEQEFLRALPWQHDLSAALRIARRTGQPLVVYVTRSDIPTRGTLETDFLLSRPWLDMARDWVCVVQVVSGIPGQRLEIPARSKQTPTFLFLDRDGQVMRQPRVRVKIWKALCKRLRLAAEESRSSMKSS